MEAAAIDTQSASPFTKGEAAQGRSGGQAFAIHQHMIRRRGQGLDRAAHGEEGRVADVERVDLGHAGPAQPDLGDLLKLRQKRLAPLRAEPLRIIEARGDTVGMQDHGGGGDGTGQRPAPDLVHAGDDARTRRHQVGLETEIRRGLGVDRHAQFIPRRMPLDKKRAAVRGYRRPPGPWGGLAWLGVRPPQGRKPASRTQPFCARQRPR